MADNYDFLGATSNVEPIGGGKVQDVMIATFRAQPSGFVFTLPIAKVDYEPSRLRLIVPVVADALNKAADDPGVTDANVYLDVDGSGQFVKHLTASVESTSGNSDITISPPYGSLFDDRFAHAAAAARDNLDAIEGA